MTWWMWVLVVFIYLVVADWVETVSTQLKSQRRTLWFLLHVLIAPIWIPRVIINGLQKLAERKKQGKETRRISMETRLDEIERHLAEYEMGIEHLTKQVTELVEGIGPVTKKEGD